MVYSERDVRDALEAIVRCRATDEAYEVIAQAGWAELVPGVVYRVEDKQMEAATAREIITQAKKDEIYDGPMPDDEATILKEAEDIVTQAEQAWAQHVRGPEVEAILKIAEGAAKNGGEPAPETPSGDAPSGDEEEERAPDVDLSGVDENLTKMEPWEGYGDETVKAVTDGINFYLDDKPEDLSALLNHIYVYESSHKNRVRILKHLKTAFEQIGATDEGQKADTGGSESESPGADEGASPEGVSEEPSGDGPEGRSQASEGQGSTPDAQTDSEPKADAPSAESGTGKHEAKPPAKDQPSGSSEDDGGESAYQKLVAQVEKELRNERLDIPTPPQEVAPSLPWNWNDVSDAQLQNMHMQFASLAYYKSYIYSRDERIAMHCKEAADTMRNELMVELPKYDDHNKEKKVGLLEAEIESNSNVRKWRRLQRRHEQFAQAAKREMESYHKVVETLSRLETMRMNAYERTRR